MIQGQAHLPDEVRENLQCLLLEFVGTDRAVQFGNPEVWRAAVANLQD